MRVDGYAELRNYALIGDGRTAALVAADGAIDWLCLPNFDSASVCGAILDQQRGGAFVVRPAIPFTTSRRYLPSTNILETTFATAEGAVRVVDAMTLPDDRLCPMRELTRSIEGLAGRVPMTWYFAPRFEYGTVDPTCVYRNGRPVALYGRDAIAICHWGAGQPAWRGCQLEGEFEAQAGQRALIALAATYSEPLVFPGRTATESRIAKTVDYWQQWAAKLRYDGPWKSAVIRSALVLKLLIFAPSGASAAAPTTSLPEEIGGVRNWDYRFCWIRDSMFLIDALLQLGCHGEAQALFWWFMQATALTEPRLQVLYRLDGGNRAPERMLPLGGYRSSAPVRTGNCAIEQRQIDLYGDLLQTAWIYGSGDQKVDRDTGRVLGRIADYVCDAWHEKDAGIWEVRGDYEHFTHSKVMCWVALDRAIRLAAEGDVPNRHVERWKSEARAIVDFVDRECWSDTRRSYTRSAGSDRTDASLLMLPLVGFGDGKGERVKSTIDAVMKELRRGPFVYRYLAADGLPGREGCFVNCSFWLAGALARVGRVEEATSLMDELVADANDVGLYAEEIQPETGAFLGNFPQALVHLALIDAALAIGEAQSRA